MTKEAITRKKKILNIIVKEYIYTATPVASETIQRKYHLDVSPATVRNYMADLEQEEYITRPHTSAGCVPLDKGYRHYVESLSDDIGLPIEEQKRIRDMFMETAEEIDRWLKMAAALISRLVGNAAIVTFPKAREGRFKHLELVSLHDFLALLVLVLSETSLKQHLLTFSEPINQDKLTAIANKFNAKFAGLIKREIIAKKLVLTKEERLVLQVITDIMTAEDEKEYEEPYLEGIRYMLMQPEFTRQERIIRILELMEARDWLRNMIKRQAEDEKIKVVIGRESGEESLKDISLVISRYGVPHRVGGTVGVIGPTRLDYHRAISTVGYISDILSYLISEVCAED